jgi:hypothetical protein
MALSRLDVRIFLRIFRAKVTFFGKTAGSCRAAGFAPQRPGACNCAYFICLFPAKGVISAADNHLEEE